ncbi:MAG TPA: 2OG-Fe(II) oxygenase [Hyphomicrobiales bacterium]|nr:2OG-Fe(II) oxygenase [Hyphomicrobiales bacterium]
MSDTIDPATLARTYPEGVCLNEDPAIWLFENYASAEEMAALQEAAFEKLAPAEVSGSKGGYISEGRSGSNCWVPHGHSVLVRQLAGRIAALVGIPLTNAESFQVVYYGSGQEYRAHFDAWETSTERGRRCMARGGQRLVTTLLYLNHVEGGGATAFPKLELRVNPVAGNLLLFHNCLPGGNERHPHSLHGGLPVLAGEKWAANLWFRERDYRRGAAE